MRVPRVVLRASVCVLAVLVLGALSVVAVGAAHGSRTLTVRVSGTGGGQVTTTPAGLACRTHCTRRYPVGAVVTLHPVPSPGSLFAGFSGACAGRTCAVVMSGNRAVNARFVANPVPPPGQVVVTERLRTAIGLFWVDPPGVTVTRVIVRRAKGPKAPMRPTAGIPVASLGPSATAVVDTHVASGTRYSYGLFVRDQYGHISRAATISTRTANTRARPLATPAATLTPESGWIMMGPFARVPGADGYSYAVCSPTGAVCAPPVPVTPAGTAITGLHNGVTYVIKLVAIGDGTGTADSRVVPQSVIPNPAALNPPDSANAGCAPTSIAAENAKAGGTGWQQPSTIGAPLIQGYAQFTSVACGDAIGLYLGTQSATPVPVQVEVWRLGDYQGAGGRLVWTSPALTVAAPATWETVDRTTNAVTAPWEETAVLTVPHAWTQGLYELRLVPVGNPSAAGAIPLVVRDDTRTTALAQVVGTNTDQMYNTWGGHSAYSTATGVSTVVSLNRPYDGYGMAQVLSEEAPLASYAESEGRDISYLTDPDLDAGTAELHAARAIVVASHSEYWTPAMRANLEAAIARGANVAFFGANSIYWHAVPADGTTGPYRTLNIWKLNQKDPNASSPTLSSTQWRMAPINRPEQSVLGEQFGCTNVLEPLTLPTPLGWVFKGVDTGPNAVAAGAQLPGVIYQETDFPDPGAPMPTGTRLAASTAFACPQRMSGLQSGSAISVVPPQQPGAGIVVDVGTRGWVCLLTGSCVTNPVYSNPALLAIDPDIVQGAMAARNDQKAEAAIQHATTNILDALLSSQAHAASLAADPTYPLARP
jgi:hypothetical protein